MTSLEQILREALRLKRRILVLLGDGIDHVREVVRMRGTSLAEISARPSATVRRRDATHTKILEHVRMMTFNELPNLTYYFLYLLARYDLLEAVISTNYDLSLEGMFERLHAHLPRPIAFNPVLKAGEQDPSGYATAQAPGAVRIFKIHGNLGFLICRGCHRLFEAPPFVLGPDGPGVAEEYEHPILHHYGPPSPATYGSHPSVVPCHPLPSPATRFSSPPQCFSYVHVQDWAVPSFSEYPLFKAIIDGALQEIRNIPFAIVSIGFKGRLPTDPALPKEEVSDALASIPPAGIRWSVLLSPDQRTKVGIGQGHEHLWNLVHAQAGDARSLGPALMGKYCLASLLRSGVCTLSSLRSHHVREFAPAFAPFGYYDRER